MSRHTNSNDIIYLSGENISIMDILNSINQYYQTQLTMEDIDYLMTIEKDIFKYLIKAKIKLSHYQEVQRIDIMGDKIFFEGLSPSRIPNSNPDLIIYDLDLGS